MANPFDTEHMHKLTWEVNRLGQFVALKIEGQQSTVILPLSTGQAKAIVREMIRVIDEIGGDKSAPGKKRR